ncbi:MAG: FAD-dependent oxidoreductase, partial [Planctomycetota bacterium]
MHDVLVVGAGLAGLSCAYELSEAGVDVLALDVNDEPGGVVGTDRITNGEGHSFLFERGPNTVQASSRSFRELCGRLGLADRLVTSADEAKRRYLFLDGALRELPRGPASFLTSKLLTGRAKRRLASEPFRRFRPAAPGATEPTLLEFFEERLGPEAAAKFAGAFV